MIKTMSSLKQMKTQVLKFRDERHWAKFHGTKDLILGLLVEAGELAEHFQYLTGEELKKYQEEFKEDIADEMADVLFWLVLMSSELDIDLEFAFDQKMRKNALKYPVRQKNKVFQNGEIGKLYERWRRRRHKNNTGL